MGGHERPLLEGERDWLLARIEPKKDLTLHELLAELRGDKRAHHPVMQRLVPGSGNAQAAEVASDSCGMPIRRYWSRQPQPGL